MGSYLSTEDLTEFEQTMARNRRENNKFLFIIDEIVNLPSNIIKSYKVMRMRLYLKKCLADIKIIEQEIKKYNLVKLEKK